MEAGKGKKEGKGGALLKNAKENDERVSKLGYMMMGDPKAPYYKSLGKKNSLKFSKKGH